MDLRFRDTQTDSVRPCLSALQAAEYYRRALELLAPQTHAQIAANLRNVEARIRSKVIGNQNG